MGLFNFLFGSDESSFNAEDYRSIHEDRRHHAKYRGPHELRERVGRGEMAAN